MTAPAYTQGGNRPGDGPLRDNGVGGTMAAATGNLPSTMSKAASAQRPALELVRDLWSGPERIRDAGPAYLPQAPGEDPSNYRTRLARSVFFNFFATAIEGLVGFVFMKTPVLGDDVPAAIVPHWENIDLAGTHGDVFARDLLQDAMIAGHAAILVDYPDTGGVMLSLGEEQAMGVRPYWVPVKKDNILSWRESIVNGHTVLDQVVLRECRMVPDGLYGEKEQTVYRVLYRENDAAKWRLEMVTARNTVVVLAEGVYANQVELPIVEVVTSGREGRFCSKPTLADVAYLNIAHYQQWSDYATSIHKTCVPLLVIAGASADGPIVVGPNSALTFTNPQASATYVSHDGASLASCAAALQSLKDAMADMSLAMLASEKRSAETAKAKQIDKGATDSKLSVTARGLQDALERALSFHARYMKLPDGGSIEVNREYTDMSMSPQLLTAYVGAITNAGLPVRVLTQAMQEGGLISPDENLDALDAEIEANAAAAADQARMDAQAAADAMAAAKGQATGNNGQAPMQKAA